jgi:amidase
VLAGPDEIETAGLSYHLPRPTKKRLADFRIGVILDHPISPVAREVSDELAKLADFLGKAGATVSDTARPAIDFAETEKLFALLLAAANSAKYPADRIEAMRQGAAVLDAGDQSWRAHMLRGGVISHRDWMQLDEARMRQRWAWHQWFADYDLLLCPALGLAAHKHIEEATESRHYQIEGKTVAQGQLLFWAGVSGLSYLPATVAPAGVTPGGLSVGVQIVGPHFGDRTTIRFAQLLEQSWLGFVAPEGYGDTTGAASGSRRALARGSARR